MRSANTSGSGRRKRRSSARLRRLTRTSLYSQCVPGRRQRPRVALASLAFQPEVAVAVDHVGLAEQLAFPFRGVLQQMPPGDAAVLRAVEPAVVHGAADRFIEVGDQPVHDGDAGQQAQIALGRREREVDLVGLAPGRDLEAAAQHQAVGRAARPDRAEDLVERRRLEIAAFQMQLQVVGPRRSRSRWRSGRLPPATSSSCRRRRRAPRAIIAPGAPCGGGTMDGNGIRSVPPDRSRRTMASARLSDQGRGRTDEAHAQSARVRYVMTIRRLGPTFCPLNCMHGCRNCKSRFPGAATAVMLQGRPRLRLRYADGGGCAATRKRPAPCRCRWRRQRG